MRIVLRRVLFMPHIVINACLIHLVMNAFLVQGTAIAGSQDEAVIALAMVPISKGVTPPCETLDGIGCSLYATGPDVVFAQRRVYVVVARANPGAGVSGLQFGVEVSPTLSVDGWSLCADEQFPVGGWPQSGGANVIAWDSDLNCQSDEVGTDGVHAVGGYFSLYAYGSGTMSITPDSTGNDPVLTVLDCAGEASDILIPGGRVGFGEATGFNPCLAEVPVERSTWGRIKSGWE